MKKTGACSYFCYSSILATPLAIFDRSFLANNSFLFLSICSLVMTTLDGCTPTCTPPPLTLSRVNLSMWMTHFLRYTAMTLPSRPLFEPRVTRTSSSLRMGTARTWCFSCKSLESGADMMRWRICDGAVKCALRLARRLLLTLELYFILPLKINRRITWPTTHVAHHDAGGVWNKSTVHSVDFCCFQASFHPPKSPNTKPNNRTQKHRPKYLDLHGCGIGELALGKLQNNHQLGKHTRRNQDRLRSHAFIVTTRL